MITIASGQEITYKHFTNNSERKLKIRNLNVKNKKKIWIFKISVHLFGDRFLRNKFLTVSIDF